ncbi:triple functional domain protein-like [Festucalex cinctus]
MAAKHPVSVKIMGSYPEVVVVTERRPVIASVCRVLDCLEQDYQREEDWCGGADNLHPKCEADLTLRIRKHLEQKEVFLKACSMARRIADIFLKYMERDGVKMGMQSHDDAQKEEVRMVIEILAGLLEREDRVLHLWNMRK